MACILWRGLFSGALNIKMTFRHLEFSNGTPEYQTKPCSWKPQTALPGGEGTFYRVTAVKKDNTHTFPFMDSPSPAVGSVIISAGEQTCPLNQNDVFFSWISLKQVT